jgi:hypothetical protein
MLEPGKANTRSIQNDNARLKKILRTRTAITVAALFAGLASRALADEHPPSSDPPLLMIGDGLGQAGTSLDYQALDVPGQAGGSPTMVDQRESGRFVISKTDRDTWSVNERFAHLGIGEPIVIPFANTIVPQDLWSLEAGGGYQHQLGGNRSYGINFTAGSDSNKLFYSIHETVFKVTANYRLPSGDQNAWLFFLNYSNNRHFLNNVPLPGVGYSFQADERKLQGIVGFPFAAMRYKPTPDWNLQASIFGPRDVNAEIGRRIAGPVHLYTAFSWSPQEWLLADRADYSNRLFFDKKRAGLGLRSPLGDGFLVDVLGGRQFDQRFFVNDSSSIRDVSIAGLPPAWFMEAKLSYRFLPRHQ